MTTELTDALGVLNRAAYNAARAARKEQDNRAADLKLIALATDSLIEGAKMKMETTK